MLFDRFASWWNSWQARKSYHRKRICLRIQSARCPNDGRKDIKSIKPIWWAPLRFVFIHHIEHFRWLKRYSNSYNTFFITLFIQNTYYDDLSRTASIENLKPVMTKLHNDSSERFLDDLTNFRRDVYRIIDDETFIKIKGWVDCCLTWTLRNNDWQRRIHNALEDDRDFEYICNILSYLQLPWYL